MRVVVMSYTGTIGKTALAVNMLFPRMLGVKFISVETINQAADALGIDIEHKLEGDDFDVVFAALLRNNDLLIDVGASNVQKFLDEMARDENAHEEFDMFVVPITPGTKEQTEAINFIDTLAAMNVPPEKIRVIFNKVSKRGVEKDFAPILGYAQSTGNCIADPRVAVSEDKIFDIATRNFTSIAAVLESKKDYVSEFREAKNLSPEDEARLFDMVQIKRVGPGVMRKLDHAFAALFESYTADILH